MLRTTGGVVSLEGMANPAWSVMADECAGALRQRWTWMRAHNVEDTLGPVVSTVLGSELKSHQ